MRKYLKKMLQYMKWETRKEIFENDDTLISNDLTWSVWVVSAVNELKKFLCSLFLLRNFSTWSAHYSTNLSQRINTDGSYHAVFDALNEWKKFLSL